MARPTTTNKFSHADQSERKNTSELRKQAAPSLLINIQDYFFLFLRNWPWFVLSLGICLGLAWLYLESTPKIYTRTVSLLIKNDSKTSGSIDESFKEISGLNTNSNITNELLSMRSGDVAGEIVKRLKLNMVYKRPGTFHDEVAYGLSLPIEVEFVGMPDAHHATCQVEYSADSTVVITNMALNGTPLDGALKGKMGQVLQTPIGNVKVSPSLNFVPGTSDKLIVTHRPMSAATASLQSRIQPRLRDKNSTIIDISFSDESTARAEDILNTFVVVYSENWVKDRNLITVSTSEFIKERLAVIEQELNNVDEDISSYKSENLMIDVNAAGAQASSQAVAAEAQSEELDNELYMAKYIRGYLTDGMHTDQLLPSATGISNATIQSQIANYNAVLLQRNKHLSNSSAQNPLVMDLEEQLSSLRVSIIQSLDNEINMLNVRKRTVASRHGSAVAKISTNPGQAKYLLSVERQQKVKESLYLFLLQKREENELSQAFTAYNTRLLESPHGSNAPTSPISKSIFTIALLLGFGIPGGFLILKENLNTSIRGRKDLEGVQIPFVGEIPQLKGTTLSKQIKQRKKKEHRNQKESLVVEDKSRNVMNEAFRVVRTNLEFILGFDSGHKVIMVTSMNPSSGKTFITANLANSLGILDKKVICVDLDLRKGSLSKYVDKHSKGVSNYLSGQVDDFHPFIQRVNNIDVIPSGTLPPNPAELFMGKRFADMIDQLREEYDYVFVDCPPVEVVADSTIIGRHVDATLFIVRAHLMDRTFLPDIQNWYLDERYPSMALILNGTTDAFSHYGYHKYGYKYGYHYGNYGYGYGVDDRDNA